MMAGLALHMCRMRKEQETLVMLKRKLRDNSNVLGMPEQEFLSSFRMDKNCFVRILDEVAPWMKRVTKSTAIPAMLKLGVFLRFLAAGSYQKAVADEHIAPMSQAKVSEIIHECLDIFEEHVCPKWIRLQMSDEEELAVKVQFYNEFGLPGVVGCLDGIHIKIKSPGDLAHLYYNEKGYYSINAMIICDCDMVIRCVDARYPGSNNDPYVWKISVVDEILKSEYDAGKENTWLLGHSGYQLLPYLMTPYRQPKDPVEYSFNAKFSKARTVVERCFSVLKNRFQCISGERGLHYSPETTTKIVNACCAVHNICIYNKSAWEHSEETKVSVSDDSCDSPDFSEEEEPSAAAVAIRDELAWAISA